MHKHGFKKLCMLLFFALIMLVTGQNALAYTAGWEAVNEYHGYLNNLSNCISEGVKFENAIYDYSTSWDVDFRYSDDLAYEEDFKASSLGGTDDIYADTVDLMLFSGHGSQYGFYFGTAIDDHLLHYNDADWGDNNLEWILIDACNVLFDNSTKFDRWGTAVFKGLHYILGYNSTCYDVDTRGQDFIKYAMYGNTVRDAWIKATIDSENGTKAAYMRAYTSDVDTYDDHLWDFGSVSSDPINPTGLAYLTWDTGPITVASAADDARQPSQNIKMADYQLENADYIVSAQMPEVPDTANLHRGIKVNIRDTAYILGHSVNKAFAFKESQSSENLRAQGRIFSSGKDSAESVITADGNGRFIEYFSSGAVKYMEDDIFSEKHPDLLTSQNLGTKAAAKSVYAEAATNFLRTNDLYKDSIDLKNVSFAKFEEYDVASKQVVVSKVVGAMVHFGYKIDGIKTYGPGAEVNVIFGDGKSVVGYINAIRGHEAVSSVSLKDPQDAVEDYIQYGEPRTLLRSGGGMVKKVFINTVELVYYLKSASVQQDEIRPHYLISGLFTCVDPTSNEKHDVKFEWLEDAVRN